MARQQRKEKPQREKKEKFLRIVQSHEFQERIAIKAKTARQKEYLSAINNYEMVFGIGPAGTGKSFCAAGIAAKMYLEKKIDKIIITRPNVPAGPELGFLPGDQNEKFAPWCAPILAILEEFMGKGALECAIEKKNIELVPFETMRGYTFNNAFVILDEAQNADYASLKMFVTRLGENCKVVIDGDLEQIDNKYSGLQKIIEVAEAARLNVPVVEFTMEDCVRSGICREWLFALYKHG